MTTTRKSYTPAFRAEIVQELLGEEQTLNQIASKHGVHPNQLHWWREAAGTAMPDNFKDEEEHYQKHLTLLKAEHEREREKEKLYAEIGKLTTQLNWPLKKLKDSVCQPSRLALVERGAAEVALVVQAELLGVSPVEFVLPQGRA